MPWWQDLIGRKQIAPLVYEPPPPTVEIASTGNTAVMLDRTASAMLKEYHRALYLWRCVDMIGQMSGSVVLDVIPSTDRPLTSEEKQIQQLMLRPNPQWSAAQLQYWITSSLAVTNKAFIKRVRSDIDGSTLELWPVPPNEIVIVYVNGSQAIKHFEHHYGTGKKEIFKVAEDGDCDLIYVHRPWLSPRSDSSPAAVAAPPAEVFTRILQRCADIVSNTSNITGVLSTEAEMAQKAVEQIKERLLRFKTGMIESGGTLVTANAKWQLTRLSEDPSMALSIEIKDSLARDVAAVFGVPTQLLGLPGQDTYNNLANARVGFLTETVLPGYVTLYTAVLNHSLMRERDAIIEPNIEALPSLAQSRLQLVDAASRATMLTLNEQRALLGYARYNDEEADVPILLEQMRVARTKVEMGAASNFGGAIGDAEG